MTTVLFDPPDGNGYSEALHHYVGRNPVGWKVHLVKAEPDNHTALCGMGVAGTGTGATFKPHGQSHLCKACEKIAQEEGP